MRDLNVDGGPFDVVTCLFDSIGYPQDDEGVLAALRSLARHIAPDGRVVWEFLHAPAIAPRRRPGASPPAHASDGRELVRTSETTIDVERMLMHVQYELWAVDGDGATEHDLEQQTNRLFTVPEMRLLAEAAGLELRGDSAGVRGRRDRAGHVSPPRRRGVALVRVAVIVTEVGRGIGGRFTFQEILLASVKRLRDKTPHEFVTIAAGYNRYAEGSAGWKARRLTTVVLTLALRAVHDVQDALIGTRVVHIPTPLERRLAAERIDLVWFPTYVEDVNLPFVCQVLDLEHRMKPWFPEVSEHGEWERRERHYRRYLPKATRVIVPGETGREQVVRFFGVDADNCLALKHPTPDFALEAAEAERKPEELVRKRGIEPPYLLYPAQFWAHKNHAAVLDALAELRSRDESMSLVFVGSDKGQRERVRTQIKEHGLGDAVHVLGWVDEDELIGLYQHAHALVYLEPLGPRTCRRSRRWRSAVPRSSRTCPAPKSSSETRR